MRIINRIIGTLCLVGLVQIAIAQNNDIASEVETLLISMKQYTLALAQQMPEEKFEYKPAESSELRTFSQHFKHIGNFMSFQLILLNNGDVGNLGEIIAANKKYEKTLMSKEKVISDLSIRFDKIISFFKETDDRNLNGTFTFFFEENQPVRSRRLIAMAVRDHISHHRAQAIVYLRENGIIPAAYTRY